MLRSVCSPLLWALFVCVALCAPRSAAAQHTAADPHKAPPKKGESDRVYTSSSTVETAKEPSKGKPSKGGAHSAREKVDSAESTVRTAESTKKSPAPKPARGTERADTGSTTTAQGGHEKARSRPAAPPVVQAKKKEKPAVVRVAPRPTRPARVPQGRPAERPR